MCIAITVTFKEAVGANMENDFRDGATLFLIPHRDHYRVKKVKVFNISDIQVGGCACGLLGEGASWNTDTWVFKSGILPLLEETVRRLAKRLRQEFLFKGMWSGRELTETSEVDLRQFLSIIRENRLSTHTQYRVAA